jgi:hypothetical protein
MYQLFTYFSLLLLLSEVFNIFLSMNKYTIKSIVFFIIKQKKKHFKKYGQLVLFARRGR